MDKYVIGNCKGFGSASQFEMKDLPSTRIAHNQDILDLKNPPTLF